MSATNIEQAFSADSFEVQFSSFYGMKDFVKDASRLRDLHKLAGLSEGERAEVSELRRRLKRVDGDAVLLFLLRSREYGGFNLI